MPCVFCSLICVWCLLVWGLFTWCLWYSSFVGFVADCVGWLWISELNVCGIVLFLVGLFWVFSVWTGMLLVCYLGLLLLVLCWFAILIMFGFPWCCLGLHDVTCWVCLLFAGVALVFGLTVLCLVRWFIWLTCCLISLGVVVLLVAHDFVLLLGFSVSLVAYLFVVLFVYFDFGNSAVSVCCLRFSCGFDGSGYLGLLCCFVSLLYLCFVFGFVVLMLHAGLMFLGFVFVCWLFVLCWW